MEKNKILVTISVSVLLAALYGGISGFLVANRVTDQEAVVINTEQTPIPLLSLYGYSTMGKTSGKNYYFNKLYPDICGAKTASPGGSASLDYAYTIFNVSLANLELYEGTRDAYVFHQNLIDLLNCAQKSGSLRVIINFNFYEYERVEGKVVEWQKNLLCPTTQTSMVYRECPDTVDGRGNITDGYHQPTLTQAMAAYKKLLEPSNSTVRRNLQKALRLTFAGSGVPVLAGITLSEENVTWDYEKQSDGSYKPVYGKADTLPPRADFLNDLYNALVKRYVTSDSLNRNWMYKFLQWYSPNTWGNYPGSNVNWPLIGADGWVYDQYHLDVSTSTSNVITRGEYYDYALSMAQLDGPVYSVVFASPLRYPTGGTRTINSEWWNSLSYANGDGGWLRFFGQVEVNKLLRIPTIFYAYTPVSRQDTPMTDSRINSNPELQKCGQDLFTFLESTTLTHLLATKDSILYRYTSEKPDWIPAAPDGCVALDTL